MSFTSVFFKIDNSEATASAIKMMTKIKKRSNYSIFDVRILLAIAREHVNTVNIVNRKEHEN